MTHRRNSFRASRRTHNPEDCAQNESDASAHRFSIAVHNLLTDLDTGEANFVGVIGRWKEKSVECYLVPSLETFLFGNSTSLKMKKKSDRLSGFLNLHLRISL